MKTVTVIALALALASAASAGVVGLTPRAAARAATVKHAEHEVHAWNRPGVSYTIGACRLLHRRPWLAWGCVWELHGAPPPHCAFRLILGVKHLADGTFSATAVKNTEVVEGC